MKPEPDNPTRGGVPTQRGTPPVGPLERPLKRPLEAQTEQQPEPAFGPPVRPSAAFMLRHPAHVLALGFGSGLSPVAPGTAGTLWAWLAFLWLDPWLSTPQWAALLLASAAVGVWACTRTAQNLRLADPGAIVWDEILAFWLVLWLVGPGFWMQLAAFALFRYFDAAKPGPVRWADQRYKVQPGQAIGWRQGWGIVFDDLVAAACTLLVLALGVRLWNF